MKHGLSNVSHHLQKTQLLILTQYTVKLTRNNILPLSLIQSLKKPFFAPVMPRLFLIAFRYSQPILIREIIRYAAAPHTEPDNNRRSWLVLSAVTIYTGLAVRLNDNLQTLAC